MDYTKLKPTKGFFEVAEIVKPLIERFQDCGLFKNIELGTDNEGYINLSVWSIKTVREKGHNVNTLINSIDISVGTDTHTKKPFISISCNPRLSGSEPFNNFRAKPEEIEPFIVRALEEIANDRR